MKNFEVYVSIVDVIVCDLLGIAVVDALRK